MSTSLLIEYPQTVITCIRLDGWLVHQLRARRRDAEFAGHFDAHGILERRVAIKIILKDDSPVVSELAVAIPIGPRSGRVVQIDAANGCHLFSTGGNWILDHYVLCARAGQVQSRHDQIARAEFAR